MKSIDTSHLQTQFSPQSKSKVARNLPFILARQAIRNLQDRRKKLLIPEKADISSAALLASQNIEAETPAEETPSGQGLKNSGSILRKLWRSKIFGKCKRTYGPVCL
jgi:hypothetical protein